VDDLHEPDAGERAPHPGERVGRDRVDELQRARARRRGPSDQPRRVGAGGEQEGGDREGRGTRLTLWHTIDRGFIATGAAGWHVRFDVLDRHLAGRPAGRVVGADALKFGGWQRLHGEYARQFGIRPAGAEPALPDPNSRG
jgi:hypothetical protein